MAPAATPAEAAKRCYHCGFESSDCKLKYYDNKKQDQPRYKCPNCTKLFTPGCRGRAQGKTFHKKRGEDPVELRGLNRQCPHCKVTNNAPFKYYNNGTPSQPRFKCLSCGKQFQMRLVMEGQEWCLVHTSKLKRSSSIEYAPSNVDTNYYWPDTNCSRPPTMTYHEDSELFREVEPHDPFGFNGGSNHEPEPTPALSGEDVDFANMVESELTEDVGPTLPATLPDEHASYVAFLEAELMSDDVVFGDADVGVSATIDGDNLGGQLTLASEEELDRDLVQWCCEDSATSSSVPSRDTTVDGEPPCLGDIIIPESEAAEEAPLDGAAFGPIPNLPELFGFGMNPSSVLGCSQQQVSQDAWFKEMGINSLLF